MIQMEKKVFLKAMIITLLFSLSIPLSGTLGAQLATSESNEFQVEIETEKIFGKEGEESTFDFIQTSDGYMLLGGVTENVSNRKFMLLKLNADLEHEWNKTLTGYGNDYVCLGGCGLIQAKDGGFVIGGDTIENITGDSNIDMWLIKTDSNGDIIWNNTYGDSFTQFGNDVIQTADGGYILAGAYGINQSDGFIIKTDAQGNQEWNKTFGGREEDQIIRIIQTSDQGYALELFTLSYGAGQSDFWLIKLDRRGNQEWNQTYGTRAAEYIGGIIETSDQGFLLVGGTYGLNRGDIVVIKTNPFGIIEWYKTYGAEAFEEVAYSVIQSSDGGYTVLAFTTRESVYKDALLLKIDSSGNQLWNKSFGGLLEDYGVEFIKTSKGDFVFAGVTTSYGTNNDQNLWVVKTKFVQSDSNAGNPIPSFTLIIAVVTLVTLLRMKSFRRR